jgi:hypothetical protein
LKNRPAHLADKCLPRFDVVDLTGIDEHCL